MKINLSEMTTEGRNSNSLNIDTMDTLEMVKTINNEDKKVAYAIESELPSIAKAVDDIAEQLKDGGRLIYIGAGTSGRLGVLDASECPPTFGTDPEKVKGIIAGGTIALTSAFEGAEDNEKEGENDLKDIHFGSKDILVGIAASGRTPYVMGALKYAQSIGAKTVAVTCNANSPMGKVADTEIALVVGAEVVTGSTRMKAGTAQKMVLNMLSTGAMIKLGKVYENLMVDVRATNKKLIERSKSIVMEATGITEEEAIIRLEKAEYDAKLAIFYTLSGIEDIVQAKKILGDNNGYIREALKAIQP